MAQPRMSKLLYRNYGTTFAAEILSSVNYGSTPVPKLVHRANYGSTPVPKLVDRVNYGNTPAAIIRNMGVSTAFLGAHQPQTLSQSGRSKLYQSLSAEFRHRFCHLPYILAFGILALSLTKFVCES